MLRWCQGYWRLWCPPWCPPQSWCPGPPWCPPQPRCPPQPWWWLWRYRTSEQQQLLWCYCLTLIPSSIWKETIKPSQCNRHQAQNLLGTRSTNSWGAAGWIESRVLGTMDGKSLSPSHMLRPGSKVVETTNTTNSNIHSHTIHRGAKWCRKSLFIPTKIK